LAVGVENKPAEKKKKTDSPSSATAKSSRGVNETISGGFVYNPKYGSKAAKYAPKLPTPVSDRLRTQAKARRTAEKEEPSRGVVNAALDAISRDHATQDDILQKLHENIVSTKELKGDRKKRGPPPMRKKSRVVDPATEAFGSESMSATPSEDLPEDTGRGGWNPDEWINRGWGNDSAQYSH
jgi:hypothetical protein